MNGKLTKWELREKKLIALVRLEGGGTASQPSDHLWHKAEDGTEYFWGIDAGNRAVKWVRGAGAEIWVLTPAGFR